MQDKSIQQSEQETSMHQITKTNTTEKKRHPQTLNPSESLKPPLISLYSETLKHTNQKLQDESEAK